MMILRKRVVLLMVVVWGLLGQAQLGFSDLDPNVVRGSNKKAVSVLQNRFFLKKWRPEIGLLAGKIMNDAYVSTTMMGVRTALFFREDLGLEYQYLTTNFSDSNDRKILNGLRYWEIDPDAGQTINRDDLVTVFPDPEVNPIKGAMDFSLVWAPFYGKLNFLNLLIMYTDLYVSAGLSSTDTQQGGKTALTYAFGQRIHFLKNFSSRIEIKVRRYDEKRNAKIFTREAMSLDFGVSYFLF